MPVSAITCLTPYRRMSIRYGPSCSLVPQRRVRFCAGGTAPAFVLGADGLGELKGEAAGLPLAAPSLGISANSGGLRGSPAKMCMTLHSCTTYTLPCVPVGWEFVSAFEPVVLAIERHSFRSRLGGLVSFGLVGGPAGSSRIGRWLMGREPARKRPAIDLTDVTGKTAEPEGRQLAAGGFK